jgi:adenylate cyclase
MPDFNQIFKKYRTKFNKSRENKVNYKKIFLIAFTITLVVSLLYYFNFFVDYREKTIDKLYLHEPEKKENPILIIAIDNKSINQLGRWPFDRKIHADLIEKITATKPAVIGLDVNFPEKSKPDSDQALVASILKAENVILPFEADFKFKENQISIKNKMFPIEVIQEQAYATGLTNLIIDKDGTIRKMFFFSYDKNFKKNFSFAYQIVDLYSKKTGLNLKIKVSNLSNKENINRINFIGSPGSFETISAIDFLNSKDKFNFQNKIVLIGATAPDLHDEYMVPTSRGLPMSGVEILANQVNTILNNNYLKEIHFFYQILIIFLLSFLAGLIIAKYKIFKASIYIFLTLTLYLLTSLILFDYQIILDIFYPVLAIIFSLIAFLSFKFIYEEKEKRFIKQTFARYVSKDIIQDLLKNPKKIRLGGEEKEVSILFSDIRSFTTISEKLSANQLVKLLNVYLTKMTNIIMDSRGVVDKYIGDAIMAFWGAPVKQKNHALFACLSALKMIKTLKKNQKKWKKLFGVDLKIGIGINTARATVGNMGSTKRFDYTIIGDGVNLAARLESITKMYKAQIVISEFTYEKVKKKFLIRYLDLVAVKGKKKSVKIYELISTKKALQKNRPALAKKQKLTLLFHRAVKLYLNRNWQKALKKFEKIKQKYPADEPTKIYIKRCLEFIKNPPGKNWNGIYEMTTK